MPVWFDIFWDDGEGGNVAHLAEHAVTPEEAEQVLEAEFERREPSRSAPRRWVVQGFTRAGRYLVVVFELEDDLTLVVPVTAYEPTR